MRFPYMALVKLFFIHYFTDIHFWIFCFCVFISLSQRCKFLLSTYFAISVLFAPLFWGTHLTELGAFSWLCIQITSGDAWGSLWDARNKLGLTMCKVNALLTAHHCGPHFAILSDSNTKKWLSKSIEFCRLLDVKLGLQFNMGFLQSLKISVQNKLIHYLLWVDVLVLYLVYIMPEVIKKS